MTELSRRSLLTGLLSFAVTAPAIVRSTSLMPIKALIDGPGCLTRIITASGNWRLVNQGVPYTKKPIPGSLGNPIIGQRAPPGMVWKIIGKWDDPCAWDRIRI